MNIGTWWDSDHTLWLITPDQFNRLPRGFELKAIDGEKVVIGTDTIDLDTRFGCLAYGVPHPCALLPISTEEEKDRIIKVCGI